MISNKEAPRGNRINIALLFFQIKYGKRQKSWAIKGFAIIYRKPLLGQNYEIIILK